MNVKQALALSALLHDIGKFLERATEEKIPASQLDYFKYEHAFCTSKFFEEYAACFPYDLSQSFSEDANDNLKGLAAYHHNPSTILQTIIQQADWMAAGLERAEAVDVPAYEGSYKRKVLLHSVFDYIHLSDQKRSPHFRYPLNALELDSKKRFLFPQANLPEDEDWTQSYLKNLWEPFVAELKQLPQNLNFDIYFASLLSLLEKYTWCIPGSTRKEEIPDVSLYDHNKITAALAVCLYEYHEATNSLSRAAVTNANEAKFLLVAGDLSGIQRYLFNLVHANIRGLSKILRARSFYLSELCAVASHAILQTLDLPLCCNVMDSGGRFVLIVPHTQAIKQKLGELYHSFSHWFKNNFAGELSLNLVWKLELTPADFDVKTFYEKLNRLNDYVEEEKYQKYSPVFKSAAGWHTEKFRVDIENRYDEKGACACCSKFPATVNVTQEIQFAEEARETFYCQRCADQIAYGKSLTDYHLIGYARKKLTPHAIAFFDTYYLNFLESENQVSNDYFLIEQIQPTTNIKFKTKYLANYVPQFEGPEPEELCPRCRIKDECNIIQSFKPGDIKTYECLATSGTTFEPDGALKGKPLLGVLKADVDRLGYMFSFGLEKLSISRYATLSRMLNIFFCGHVTEMLRSNSGFQNIYTVYSGGDDLFLIGEWKQIIEFARQLYQDFKKFTCDNDDLHLSAGIATIKPRYPIYRAAEQVEALLKKSKKDHDQITVFNTTTHWRDFESLMQFAQFLDDQVRKKRLKLGFVYRLLKYHRMFLQATEQGLVEELRFHALMSYDLERNVVQRDKGQITNKDIVQQLYKLYDLKKIDRSLMKNLKIPVFWVLYKNRK